MKVIDWVEGIVNLILTILAVVILPASLLGCVWGEYPYWIKIVETAAILCIFLSLAGMGINGVKREMKK